MTAAVTSPIDTLQPIKGARFSNRMLAGNGYILSEIVSLSDQAVEFTLHLSTIEPVSFVFGFQGVGNHYRCDILPARNLIVLHAIRDGIPVYLQHASIQFPQNSAIEIRWSKGAIQAHLNGPCIMNVLADGIDRGKWGFAAEGTSYRLPSVTVKKTPLVQYRHVIVGDGYSNNRWKNRHFFSWPELAFGNTKTYLNACVAAGNTTRVQTVVNDISEPLKGAIVIIAAGADDFIEGNSAESMIQRLLQILNDIRNAGAAEVHLCAIPPRARNDERVRVFNDRIRELADKHANGFIDFHSALSKHAPDLIINGDYPGAQAQHVMAETALLHLEDGQLSLSPVLHVDLFPSVGIRTARLLNRIGRQIDKALARIPTTGVA